MKRKIKIITLFLVGLIASSIGLSWTTLPSIINIIINNSFYGVNAKNYAILSSVFIVSALIFANIGGVLGRKHGLKTMIIRGLTLVFLGLSCYLMGYAWINHFFGIAMLAQILLGIGICFLLTSLTSYVCLLLPNISAIALTGLFACINLGSILCPIFYNIQPSHKWWVKCLIIVILLFSLLLISLKFLPAIHNPNILAKTKNANLVQKKYRIMWLFLIILILYSICEYIYAFWGIVFLNKIKGFSLFFSRYELSYFWAAFGFGQILIFWLLRFIAPKYFYRILPVLITIGFFIMLYSNNSIYSTFGFIIGGIGCSSFFPLTLSFVELSFKEIAEIISGIMITGYFAGYLLGAITAGVISKYTSLNSIFFTAIIIAILIAFMSCYLMAKPKKTSNI